MDRTAATARRDRQARADLRDLVDRMAHGARRVQPVRQENPAVWGRPALRGLLARQARRDLRGLRVRKATKARLLKPARPASRVRS